jgi:pyoverdine/dityrosine biosynthesis protein Dit1
MSKSSARLRILEAAFEEFAAHGFEATTMRRVATRAGCSLGLAYTYFPSKHGLGLALYQRVADDVEAEIPNLPDGTVADRFAALMEREFAFLDAHRGTLTALIAAGIDPTGPLGALSESTAAIRSRNASAFAAAVAGGSDAPREPRDRAALGRLIYGVHLLLILVWTQDVDGTLARQVLSVARKALRGAVPLLLLPPIKEPLDRLDAAFGSRLTASVSAEVEERADILITRLLRHRRLLDPGPITEAAKVPHLGRIRAALAAARPLEFVLPGFPAKSPSPEKTLGPLPDMAEVLALRSLQSLCDDLAEAHPPGVVLTLCSDGGVFADLVGVTDEQVLAYGHRIDALIEDLPSIRRFDLAEAFGDMDPPAARERLMGAWGEDVEALRERARETPALRMLLDGMQRLLFEDRLGLDRRSRTQIRESAGRDAVELLRRSRAWGRLVSFQFPEAVRLSIHPQPAISHKLGVHLMPTQDAWLTPWHGVALLGEDGFELVKRRDAEASGAVLIEVDGRPSHYEVKS